MVSESKASGLKEALLCLFLQMLQASKSTQQACRFASILFSLHRMSKALREVPSMEYN